MKKAGYISILVVLMLAAYLLLRADKQKSYADKISTDIQYEGADGHVYCKIHDVRFVEVDGFIPDRILLIDFSDDFYEFTESYPNHLSRIHSNLSKTDTYNTGYRLGFCTDCEAKFNTALNQSSLLKKDKSEQGSAHQSTTAP